MAKIKFTIEDINKSKLIEPGWYTFLIKNVKDMPNKKDAAKTNTVVSFVGQNGDAEGCEILSFFPEDYPAMAIPLAEALLGRPVKLGDEVDFSPSVGTLIEGYVRHRKSDKKDDNRTFNEIAEFRSTK